MLGIKDRPAYVSPKKCLYVQVSTSVSITSGGFSTTAESNYQAVTGKSDTSGTLGRYCNILNVKATCFLLILATCTFRDAQFKSRAHRRYTPHLSCGRIHTERLLSRRHEILVSPGRLWQL